MALGTGAHGLTEDDLLPVVRRMAGDAEARIRAWEAEPLAGGLFTPPWRFRGQAETGGGLAVGWVCVAKRARPTDVEPALYGSGALAALGGPVRAPICYGVHDAGDAAWIWLEHVVDEMPGPWPTERMALAARHLGTVQVRLTLGGRRTAAAVPPLDLDALVAGPLREAADSEALWSLPPFADLARRGGRERLRRLQTEWPALRAALATVPRVLCHGDFHRHNLCASGARAGATTVALDWQMATLGWLGHDIAGLAFGVIPEAPAMLRPDFPEVEAALLEAYAAGLREAGWAGDRRLVELGYLASTLHRARLQVVLGMAGDPRRREGVVVARLGGFEAMSRCIAIRTEVALARLERGYRLAASVVRW